jgi:hypothetical protein
VDPPVQADNPQEFLVAGMRVKIFPDGGHNIIDIRGRKGDAFFLAVITPERTLSHLKACIAAVEQAILQAGKG